MVVINKISLENFTVFEKLDLEFSKGVNLFIGENGVGKTHLIKVLYSACQAVKPEVSFPHKIVRVFRPDKSNLRRLVSRKHKSNIAEIKVTSDSAVLGMTFTTKASKWDADVTGEMLWKQQSGSLESTLIPAKEILSDAWNLTEMALKGKVDFDDTDLDLIAAAKDDRSQENIGTAQKQQLDLLQGIIGGTVSVEKERFYLRPGIQPKIEFSLLDQGIRKLALLWLLIKNGVLEQGSILCLDEPEANVSPNHIPVLVELLLELQRSGVQIFISSHDYALAKYFEMKQKEKDDLRFFSLYKNEQTVLWETNPRFSDLKNNPIMKAYSSLRWMS